METQQAAQYGSPGTGTARVTTFLRETWKKAHKGQKFYFFQVGPHLCPYLKALVS